MSIGGGGGEWYPRDVCPWGEVVVRGTRGMCVHRGRWW